MKLQMKFIIELLTNWERGGKPLFSRAPTVVSKLARGVLHYITIHDFCQEQIYENIFMKKSQKFSQKTIDILAPMRYYNSVKSERQTI